MERGREMEREVREQRWGKGVCQMKQAHTPKATALPAHEPPHLIQQRHRAHRKAKLLQSLVQSHRVHSSLSDQGHALCHVGAQAAARTEGGGGGRGG